MHAGQQVPLETVTEVITLQNGDTVTYDVKVVPHHGPIVPTIVNGQVLPPNPAQGALSVRWTGMDPTEEFKAVFTMLEATNVDEARAALEDFDTGGQNWMLADDQGDILWTSHVKVPIRDAGALSWDAASYQGTLPCLVLPGDGSADWTGYFADDSVPWAKNPSAGYLATANQDAVGGTLDNDPSNDSHPDGHSGYLACSFAYGFRQGRIKSRIEGHGAAVSMDDMASIQADARSPLGSRLVPPLLAAIDAVEQEVQTGGTHPDLTALCASADFVALDLAGLRALLEAWRDEADYESHAGVNLDDNQPLPLTQLEARASQATLLFNVWMPNLFFRVFGDELDRIGSRGTGNDVPSMLYLLESDPTTLATYDAASGDSALFDDMATVEIESRNERIIRALIDAAAWLDAEAGPMADWRWGRFHTVTFNPLIPVWAPLSIPSPGDALFKGGFPRHGDMYVVDASNFSPRLQDDGSIRHSYGSGPTQRFVITLDPDGLKVKNALPGGAVWDRDSPHFADQAERWRRNETRDVPFVVNDVVAYAESHSLVVPKP
jgi:penicillin amidase